MFIYQKLYKKKKTGVFIIKRKYKKFMWIKKLKNKIKVKM